jgi:hypothetical protein
MIGHHFIKDSAAPLKISYKENDSQKFENFSQWNSSNSLKMKIESRETLQGFLQLKEQF